MGQNLPAVHPHQEQSIQQDGFHALMAAASVVLNRCPFPLRGSRGASIGAAIWGRVRPVGVRQQKLSPGVGPDRIRGLPASRRLRRNRLIRKKRRGKVEPRTGLRSAQIAFPNGCTERLRAADGQTQTAAPPFCRESEGRPPAGNGPKDRFQLVGGIAASLPITDDEWTAPVRRPPSSPGPVI